MTPAVREPARRGRPARLADPADVEFALRALLGPEPHARAAAAARLPDAPTLAQVVEAACGDRGRPARRLALRLLDAYFELDPPVPASGDPAS